MTMREEARALPRPDVASAPNGGGDGSAIGQARLLQYAVDVVLGGGQGDRQGAGDLFVAQALGDEGGHLELTAGEALDGGVRTRSLAQHDHRMAEVFGGAVVDRDRTHALDGLGQGRDLVVRQALARLGLKRSHKFAQPAKLLGIHRRKSFRHDSAIICQFIGDSNAS